MATEPTTNPLNNDNGKENNDEEKKIEIDDNDSYITIPISIERQPVRTFLAWKIKGTNLTLMGYSRSRDKTFFYIPQLKVALDGGYCRGRLANHLFLTHGHADHSYDIGYMCTHQKNMKIYCPIQIINHINNYCKIFVELNGNKQLPDKPDWHFKIDGCCHNDVRYFGPKNNNNNKKKNNGNNDKYRVTAFNCHHAVPCLGFMFDEKRKRRKKEYKNLDFQKNKQEIIKLKKDGVEIMEYYYLPLFVYVGDTNIDVFNSSSNILKYPVIIIECTFLNDGDKSNEQLKKDGHINWNQLKPFVLKYSFITFVLIHFSCRYKQEEIIEFFKNEDKAIQKESNGQNNLKNCVIWACKQDDGTQKLNL